MMVAKMNGMTILGVQQAGSNVAVKAVDVPKHTLPQKLALYDVALHSGEAMANIPVGVEKM